MVVFSGNSVLLYFYLGSFKVYPGKVKMREYSLIAVFSLLWVVVIDRLTRVNILRKKEFYLFMLIILGFKLLVNGYLTKTNIVIYNPQFFLEIRLGSIPLEDFLFGFSMVSLSIIFWEFFKQPKKGS